MKLFSSQSADGRRLFATGLPLPADAGPARPLAATPRASLGVSSRSPARPCRPRADLMWQPSCRPRNRVGGHLISKPSQALSLSPGLADGPV